MVRLSRYDAAKLLREKGRSYSFISDKLEIPKSTLSSWFAKEHWSVDTKIKLNRLRLKKASENLVAANVVRTRNYQKRRVGYINEARFEFRKLVTNRLFLLGMGLYWGEGDKTTNGRVAVINTDSELLKVVVDFYRQCLGVFDKDLRVGLFVYEDMDKERVLLFWSEILKVPRQQFIKVQVLKSRSRLTKHKSENGVCSVYFSSTRVSVKIHEWIRLLSIHRLSD